MKYSKEAYSNMYMYRNNLTAFRFKDQHVVRPKRIHYCGMCSTPIESGSECLYVEQVWKPDGWFRTWVCEDCCNRWLEATHQIKEGDLQK